MNHRRDSRMRRAWCCPLHTINIIRKKGNDKSRVQRKSQKRQKQDKPMLKCGTVGCSLGAPKSQYFSQYVLESAGDNECRAVKLSCTRAVLMLLRNDRKLLKISFNSIRCQTSIIGSIC